jgi:hypothetical protein
VSPDADYATRNPRAKLFGEGSFSENHWDQLQEASPSVLATAHMLMPLHHQHEELGVFRLKRAESVLVHLGCERHGQLLRRKHRLRVWAAQDNRTRSNATLQTLVGCVVHRHRGKCALLIEVLETVRSMRCGILRTPVTQHSNACATSFGTGASAAVTSRGTWPEQTPPRSSKCKP